MQKQVPLMLAGAAPFFKSAYEVRMTKSLPNLPNFDLSLSKAEIDAIASFNHFKKVLEQERQDHERAKKLLSYGEIFQNSTMQQALYDVENELKVDGQLTQRQIAFLILEAAGIDALHWAKKQGSKGGLAKKGTKSDIYKVLLDITKKIKSCSYTEVSKYLNTNNDDLKHITIIRSELPTKLGFNGELEYSDSKNRVKSIQSHGIAKHLRNIENLENVNK